MSHPAPVCPAAAERPRVQERPPPGEAPVPVWVSHTPPPDPLPEDGGLSWSGGTTSTAPCGGGGSEGDKGSLRGAARSLPRRAWSALQRWGEGRGGADAPGSSSSEGKILPNGTRVSPPVSPLLGRRVWGGGREEEEEGRGPLLSDSPVGGGCPEDSLLSSLHAAELYAEKVEAYQLKYSYLKSWPGLLRLLAGLEMLLGGMVVACVVAYIQKDQEWSSAYGAYNGAYNNGQGPSGYSYRGPMTTFVLAAAGVSWVITLVLLVLGMSMYYRAILLDSPWWPLTEALVNLAVFALYMAAGVVRLNDLSRGGLCYMAVGLNPVVASLCRVEGGQAAGTAFLFINMLMYLVGFLVALKMWRHEATRRARTRLQNTEEQHPSSIKLTPTKPKHTRRIAFEDDMHPKPINKHAHFTEAGEHPVTRNRNTPPYLPEVHVIADYIVKYPEIQCVEEREQYKAVFNDQYQEYKDLHRDICATLSKFRELDAMMAKLLKDGSNHEERTRIQRIMKNYEVKKNDPAFHEKQERYSYLKAKLNHIKKRIYIFDQETTGNSWT